MQDVYKNTEEYNSRKKRKVLIVFDDMITDTINKKTKSNNNWTISIAFITQSYFKIPKEVRLSTMHFFIVKIPNKRESQQIAINQSSDVDSKDFMKIHKLCTAEKDFL